MMREEGDASVATGDLMSRAKAGERDRSRN
jgi:hypothetical protein